MTQRNEANGLPTDNTEENERQPGTSGDGDENLKAEDEIPYVRDMNVTISTGTVQSAPAESSAHLEQTLERSDDEMSSNVRSTSQRGGPGANEESWREPTSLEISYGLESPSHSNENAAGGDQKLSQVATIILGEIRKQFLSRLSGAGGTRVPWLYLTNGPSPLSISMMVKRGKKVDLLWSYTGVKLSNEEADAIRDAWPRHRSVKGMAQFLVESDGTRPVNNVSWNSVGEDFQQRLDWHIRHDSSHQKRNDVQFSAYESLWQQWCFDAVESERKEKDQSSPDHADISSLPSNFRGQMIYCELENYKKERHMFPLDQLACVLSYDVPFIWPPSKWGLPGHLCMAFDLKRLLLFLRQGFKSKVDAQLSVYERHFIQFQLRYFRPISITRTGESKLRYPCFLGNRQRATIGRGSAIQCLEETRLLARLIVSQGFPGLFSILILADEDMSPTARGSHRGPNWARYGLRSCERGTAITHYMFEVSRVLAWSFDSWSNALDWIDKLVHVNLSDFEDEKRVEDLMFDKSFTRSKDYFIAIQLLRIMDEWLDELLQSIDDLRDMPPSIRATFCFDEAEDNINLAIKGMKERATRFQSRVRKKAEECKSLRDGLFNATSLREATKAMALNQAIYVFTVVTVLFTPVSFLATFWALPFLNNPVEEGSDMVPEPSSFRSSFVTLPLLTYALVIGIAWYMRPDQSRYKLPDWLTGIWDTTRETLRSAWNSFPREIKRTRRNAQGGSDAGDSA